MDAVRATPMEDFMKVMQVDFEAYKKVILKDTATALEILTKEARSTVHIATVYGSDDEYERPTCQFAVVKTEVKDTEEDPVKTFKDALATFQADVRTGMEARVVEAIERARLTTSVVVELKNAKKDEEQLLKVGKELTGQRGTKMLREKGLSVSKFLTEELPGDRQCCKCHFQGQFAKELKKRKINECIAYGVTNAPLKRQNHYLGFAYMDVEDRPLMLHVLGSMEDDLEWRHFSHEDEKPGKRVRAKKEIKVKTEQVDQ